MLSKTTNVFLKHFDEKEKDLHGSLQKPDGHITVIVLK